MAKLKRKAKGPDNRPARVRYWASRHLEKNKIKNLMKHCGMTRAEATKFWREGSPKKDGRGRRLGRVPSGYLV